MALPPGDGPVVQTNKDNKVKYQSDPALLGNIEPHAPLLTVPHEDQLLFKIVTIKNLLRSVVDSYLHFNRVDSYVDFPDADPHDGQQLPEDIQGNRMARFGKAPEFSAADYYNRSRERTYACCFSLENSDFDGLIALFDRGSDQANGLNFRKIISDCGTKKSLK